VAALLRGETLDRRRVAAAFGIQVANADRYLKVIARELPGVRRFPRGALRFDMASVWDPASFPTAIAACLGSGLARLFRGSQYEGGMRNALAYVIRNTHRKSEFRDLHRKFVFLEKGGDSSLPEKSGILDDAIDAVLRQRAATITYQRFSSEVDELRIEPLSIIVYEHQLYVLGRSPEDGIHPYRLSRIQKLAVSEQQFEYPDRSEYDPDQVFRDSFGIYIGVSTSVDVVLRLAPIWETYSRSHRWHPSQVVKSGSDGVTITVHVRLTPEVKAWILGFGADAEVLGPAELRLEVAQDAQRLSRMYGGARRRRRNPAENKATSPRRRGGPSRKPAR
jgi:predicted DNA-binding transcriptional regulator YafY